jgi:hypothetical protein
MSRRLLPAIIVAVLVAALPRSSAAQACWAGVHSHSSPPNIMRNPHIYNVFWGASYWNAASNQRAALDSAWSDLASYGPFWARLAEYGVGMGSFGYSQVYDPAMVNQGGGLYLNESDIQAELDNEVNVIPHAVDPNDLFVIYLPPNAASAYDADNSAVGHHLSFVDRYGYTIRYAVIEFATVDYQTVVASHEISEAATDPDPLTNPGYYANNGYEIGDLCTVRGNELGNSYWMQGHLIQEVWSENGCGCVQTQWTPPVCTTVPHICCTHPTLPVCDRGGGD